jgi:hypothetical protein
MLLPACEQQADHSTNGCATNRFIGHDLCLLVFMDMCYAKLLIIVGCMVVDFELLPNVCWFSWTCAMLNF